MTLIDRARDRYGLAIDVYFPDAARIESFVRTHGVNAFYDSVELRQACCAIRKTEPLRRALAGKGAWITGLRRAQSVTRSDAARTRNSTPRTALPKFNPLVDWSEDDVWTYIRAPQRSLQRAARSRLSQHRLRAVHARRRARRGRARRTLVVGEPGAQGMRAASASGRASIRKRRPQKLELTAS